MSISIRNDEFKRMGFTHFVDHGNGKTTCFEMTQCENCGADIQAPNAIGGSTVDIPFYLSIGMKQVTELPEEGYYSDECEGEACYNCNG
jgi:hypothetical protein